MSPTEIKDFYSQHIERLGKTNLAGWAQGRCPFHEDKNASISVHMEYGNWKCFAGCAEGKGTIYRFAELIGKPISKSPSVVKTFDYGGYKKELYDDKGFKFFHEEDGKKIYNAGSAPKALYGVDRIEKAKKKDTIFIVEGEKKSDFLVSMGFPAVTSGSSTSWAPAFAEKLRDRHIVVWGDNDKPGEDFSGNVISSLQKDAASLKKISMPDLPPGGDCEDWFLLGGTSEKLIDIIKKLPDIAMRKVPMIWLDRASNILAFPPAPVSWLIENLWTDNSRGIIGGEPKAYKTWVAMDMAISIVTGTQSLGKCKVSNPGPVIFVAEESKTAEIRRHLGELINGKNIDKFALKELYLSIQRGVRIDDPDWQNHIKKSCKILKPRAIILDPYIRMQSADENSAQAQQPVLRFLRSLQSDYNTSVILIHHMRKSSKDDNSREGQRLRGSSDLHAWVDCGIYLTRAPGENKTGAVIELRDAEPPDPFAISLQSDETTVTLKAEEGTLNDLKISEQVNKIVEYIKSKNPQEALNSEIFDLITGSKQYRLEILNECAKVLDKNTDQLVLGKTGKMRHQTVWKLPQNLHGIY